MIALNRGSLSRYIAEMRLYLATKPADILELNESRQDGSVSGGKVRLRS